MQVKRPTEAEVLDDYRKGMHAVADQLALLVGKDAAAPIGGLSVAELCDLNPDSSASDQILASDGAELVRQIYRFAFLGKLSNWLLEEIDDDEPGRWETMFAGLATFVSPNWGGSLFHQCLRTLRIANLRVALMPGTVSLTIAGKDIVQGCIQIRELALLSGLEEKTLRNIASPTHKQHLQTIKRGPRTYVPVEVALPWLEARGFAPIIFDEAPATRDLATNPFYSKADMANFVKVRSEECGLSESADGEAVDTEMLARIDALLRGEDRQDSSVLYEVGKALYPANPAAFVDAAQNVSLMAARITSL